MENGKEFSSISSRTKMEERALTCLTGMLNARNVKVDSSELLGNSLEETRMYNLGGILIIFSEKGRLTENVVNSYITFANDNKFMNGTIVVSLVPPSESILEIVRTHINNPKNFLLQIFDIRRLQFDITTHRKVPPHRILTQSEIEKLMRKMNITDSKTQLPWIDSQDAMAKWIGARTGDIIEIIRFSESAGATTYYRYCAGNVLET